MIMCNDRTVFRLCEKILFQAKLVFLNKMIGTAQYLRRRAVILIQKNRFRRGVHLVKINQKFDVRAAPFVYVLIRVTNDHQVFVFAREDINKL